MIFSSNKGSFFVLFERFTAILTGKTHLKIGKTHSKTRLNSEEHQNFHFRAEIVIFE